MAKAAIRWTSRLSALLGLTALTLTHEIEFFYLYPCWAAFLYSVVGERLTLVSRTAKRSETLFGVFMIAVLILDLGIRKSSLFVSIAHLLLLFQALKCLGIKERKDELLILLFGFFQALSACTLSVDLWQAAILFALIPTATAALFWQQVSREQELSGETVPIPVQHLYSRFTLVMCLAAIPINLVLTSLVFILFPRLTLNAAFPGLIGRSHSGYVEQVGLGSNGTIGEDNSTVLWVEIKSKTNLPELAYLRGTTLDFFDGQRWTRTRPDYSQTLIPYPGGIFRFGIRDPHHPPLHYSITLINTSASTVFVLPQALEVVAPFATLQRDSDGSLRWTGGWRKPLRYDVLSDNRAFTDRPSPKDLQVPEAGLEHVRVFAASVAGHGSALSRAQAIEATLRKRYQYTLETGDIATSANPLDNFLFNRKRGPCGYFASAMVVMLRLQGIPARIAAGYLKGEWNSVAQQYCVRERDAHAWVEAYTGPEGWLSFDPTPRPAPTGPTAAHRWTVSLAQYWDFWNYKWNKLVIEYDLYSQIRVIGQIQQTSQQMGRWFDALSFSRPRNASAASRPSRSPMRLIGGLILITVFILGVFKRRASLVRGHIEFARYNQFLVMLAQQGWPKKGGETGLEFLQRLEEHHYQDLPHAKEETLLYYSDRFERR